MGYATDLPDNEWQILEPLLEPKPKGRPRKHGLREICNAIRYVQRTGCQWRLLPNDFPPWRVVYMTFWRWRNSGLWERIVRGAKFRAGVDFFLAPTRCGLIQPPCGRPARHRWSAAG